MSSLRTTTRAILTGRRSSGTRSSWRSTPTACWAAPSPGAAVVRLLAGMLSCSPAVGAGGAWWSATPARPPGHPVYRCDRPNLMLVRASVLHVRRFPRRCRARPRAPARRRTDGHRGGVGGRTQAYGSAPGTAAHRRTRAPAGPLRPPSLAERRYAACDPDNRLIAAQLEKSWETALRRVEACKARLEAASAAEATTPAPDFTGLAADLGAAWDAPGGEGRGQSVCPCPMRPAIDVYLLGNQASSASSPSERITICKHSTTATEAFSLVGLFGVLRPHRVCALRSTRAWLIIDKG